VSPPPSRDAELVVPKAISESARDHSGQRSVSRDRQSDPPAGNRCMSHDSIRKTAGKMKTRKHDEDGCRGSSHSAGGLTTQILCRRPHPTEMGQIFGRTATVRCSTGAESTIFMYAHTPLTGSLCPFFARQSSDSPQEKPGKRTKYLTHASENCNRTPTHGCGVSTVHAGWSSTVHVEGLRMDPNVAVPNDR